MIIALVFIGFFLFVALTMVLPGVKYVFTPIWASVGQGIVAFIGWSWRWCVYAIKITISAHIEVFRNIFLSNHEMEILKKTKEKK